MKKIALRLGLAILGMGWALAVGCSEKPPSSAAGDLTGQFHSGTTAANLSSPAPSKGGAMTADTAAPSAATSSESEAGPPPARAKDAAASGSPATEPAVMARDADAERANTEASLAGPASPKYLTVQVVKSSREGALDIYVTNIWDQDITACVLVPFEGIEIKLPPLIRPGQVTMCGLEGEVPQQLTFQADQFDSFPFAFPEPLEELDVSRFDWAVMDDPVAEESADRPAKQDPPPSHDGASGKDSK